MDKPSDFLAVLQAVHDFEARAIDWPALRWVVLSNTTQDPLLPFLKRACFEIGYKADIRVGGYDTALQDVSADRSPLFEPAPDVVVVALRLHVLAPSLVDRFLSLSADAIEAETRRVLEYLVGVTAGIRRHAPNALTLVHSFETPLYPDLGLLDYRSVTGQVNTIRKLNLELTERLSPESNVLIADVDALRARVGDAFEDARTWHIGRVAYSRDAMAAIAADYMKAVRALKGLNKKCLAVDADNTLWGGIVGEDGVEGIAIGRSFPGSASYEFQQALLALRHRGVLLALCSKNDPEAVAGAFAARAADMPLGLADFAATRVNWRDKAENLRAIADELNIGLDSLVFMDDSAFETDLVREFLPEVQTILLPSDPTRFRDVLARAGLFDTLTFSEEDRRRHDLYAMERQRQRERAAPAVSVADYLAGLAMEVDVTSVDSTTVARVAQLTQKTNQFNLTTKRYSEGDIRAMAGAPEWDVLAVRLRDRIGDAGLIGVAILRCEADMSIIDTFLLSCRVLARGIEDVLLAVCAARSSARGSRAIVGQFVPTDRNAQVRDFFPARGFDADCDGRFRRPLGSGTPFDMPTFIKRVTVNGERMH